MASALAAHINRVAAKRAARKVAPQVRKSISKSKRGMKPGKRC